MIPLIIGADGSIPATFQMFIPGDLGLEGEAEPIFVGIAELAALVSPTGEVEEIVEREQNGNHRFVALGGRQALTVTDGEAVVPTAVAAASNFERFAPADCRVKYKRCVDLLAPHERSQQINSDPTRHRHQQRIRCGRCTSLPDGSRTY